MSRLLKAREISGEKIEALPPGKFPARLPLEGDYVRLEPLDPQQHAAELFQASHEGEEVRLWDYLPDGPFADPAAFARYSMLDAEWPMIRENFQRWLSPDNFDADGQPRLSLGALNRALRGIG